MSRTTIGPPATKGPIPHKSKDNSIIKIVQIIQFQLHFLMTYTKKQISKKSYFHLMFTNCVKIVCGIRFHYDWSLRFEGPLIAGGPIVIRHILPSDHTFRCVNKKMECTEKVTKLIFKGRCLTSEILKITISYFKNL